MKTLKQTCKEVGITVQQYQKWLKRAKDNKCEVLLVTHEVGDSQNYPYHVNRREDMNWVREHLESQEIEILLEVMI